MQVIHLGQKELAERWRMSEATLERWRSDRIGPVFLKIRGRVLYRHVDIRPSVSGLGVQVCWNTHLSMIAREITSSRWSGPVFFGLKDYAAKSTAKKGGSK